MLGMPFTTWEEFGAWLLGVPLRILLILVLAVVARWLVFRTIRGIESSMVERAERHQRGAFGRVLDAATGAEVERRRQRALTLGSLMRNIAVIAIFTVTFLTILAEFDVSLAPLLASAGVAGIALGFGAQELVKDFLAGIFMIVEDQYGVGDVIDAGEAVGTVEEVTLRVTRLRDASGVVWFIRNGQILRVGNTSLGYAMATIDIPVAYDEDPARVIPLLEQVADEVWADEEQREKLVEAPTVAGVESVSGGVMTLRIFAKCRPGEQWAMPRLIRQRVKVVLDEAGVRGPQITPYGPQQP
jgi:moderate conductance mechanosensitive channel